MVGYRYVFDFGLGIGADVFLGYLDADCVATGRYCLDKGFVFSAGPSAGYVW